MTWGCLLEEQSVPPGTSGIASPVSPVTTTCINTDKLSTMFISLSHTYSLTFRLLQLLFCTLVTDLEKMCKLLLFLVHSTAAKLSPLNRKRPLISEAVQSDS